jgi:anaerobic magnesium-protoporphyrin IX monomethyl ester cyclase
MNKSIAFIYLPHPWLKQPDAQLPLGILYLAAITRNAGYDTTVYNFSGYGYYDALTKIKEHTFFAITATSLEIPMANAFGNSLKEMFPDCNLLIGGPGTITPEYIDKCFGLVFIGEAETQLIDFLDHWLPCRIVHTNGTPKYILDNIPFPARDLVNGSLGGEIFAKGRNYNGELSTTILSSRGCPYRCAFCAAPRTNIRFREPGWVVAEMLHIAEKYGIYQFRFSDDSFTLNRERVLAICKGIKNNFKGEEIAWRVSCRVKPIDAYMISAMVEAGCKEFSFGIESFDQNVLNYLNKGTTIQDNINALNVVDQCGGKSRILFMIRTPGQDLETVDKNIRALEKVPYEVIACTSFAPLPGSDIWENPSNYGIRILSRNLSDYNFYFYGTTGRQKIPRLFEYTNRDTEKIEIDSERFRTYLEVTGKLNKG